MIKKVWGKNFGILKEFSVDLKPITILVGPNASGKSTLLRALRTLALIARSPLYTKTVESLRIQEGMDLEQFLKLQGEPFTIGVEVESEEGEGAYEVKIGFDGTRVAVIDESAKWSAKIGGSTFEYNQDNEPFRFDHRGIELTSRVPRGSSLPFFSFPYYQNSEEWRRKLAPLFQLTAAFSPFFVYRFAPSRIGYPSDPGAGVSHDGAGLASALDEFLGRDRDKYTNLETRLIELMPHIKRLNIDSVNSRGRVKKRLIFETHAGVGVPAELESDGVLLAIAYLWLTSVKGAAGIGIEEPETGTYPKLIGERWKLLRSIAERERDPVQVLVTTHSANLLHEVGDPGLLRIFERDTATGWSRIYSPPEPTMPGVIWNRLGWAEFHN